MANDYWICMKHGICKTDSPIVDAASINFWRDGLSIN